jgi:hypothetical protein
MFMVAYFVPSGTFLAAQQKNDNWVAYPMHISPSAGSSFPIGYNVNQIRTAYNLPSLGGVGTVIAIIVAFDTPNILDYFNIFSENYNLPDNTSGNFFIHKMAQSMQSDSSWSLEACLDVEWAHAMAPNATILLVEAVAATNNALLSAVDYATRQPGVVAVSMSWGGEEFSGEINYSYESHFNKPGITFFASSGDDGSTVMWPAASSNVVSVGGTTLNLNPDGTVISETAWRNSSGGLSSYVAMPGYQTNYGLNFSNRAVPDVSYNGNPSTGIPVYNGTWWKLGGTSAGAPQWAAIHALGLSATNNNLYSRAKSTYSSYFRDITQGSNYINSTVSDYDLVTGLGSPLTFKFGTSFDLSPISGPSNGAITLCGLGFTAGSSVNISYLEPLTFSWIPIINNFATTTENFTYTINAPDLGLNIPAGDNQAVFDKIIFRAQDNSNRRSYNTTVPYSEGRRGFGQIGNVNANGLFGNNTNLASTVFVQSGQSIAVSGSWFSPGVGSLFWDDNLNLGIAMIDETGFFNATVQIPTAIAGQHRLTINDNGNIFSVNLTCLPMVSNDYIDGWHTSDVTINLTPDYFVNETFYRVNDGSILNVTANGQPKITTEGTGNSLEYWSTWIVYGTSLNELPHTTVTGIKLDKTPPIGTIITNTTTSSTSITLSILATDDTSGVAQMRFSNNDSPWSNWEPYSTFKIWDLQDGDGQKTINVQFMDNAGLTSTSNYTLTLLTPHQGLTPTPTSSPTPASLSIQSESSSPTPTPIPTASPTPNPTQITEPKTIPEAPEWILILIVLSTLMLALLFRKNRKSTII